MNTHRRNRWPRRAALAAALIAAGPAWALDERYDDLQASVEVAPVFSLSLSNPHLEFHQLSPGNTYTIGEGGFYNEVRCRSNNGRPWYLKAQLMSLRHVGMNASLPADALRWKAASVSGAGEPPSGRWDFEPFAERPVLIYASRGEDERGREVVLQFQYSLTCPLTAQAGDYIGQIIFTMAESP